MLYENISKNVEELYY